MILKVIKTNVNYQASAPLRTQNAAQNIASNAASLQFQAKLLCATSLALMLRYATFIQPPTIRARDDHIVVTIVNAMKENSKNSDGKVRRRLVAALGEIVFYISAQEEDANSTTGGNEASNDKWTLPVAAIDLLTKCLKEEQDEVIKHYAAKVSERCHFRIADAN